MPTLNTRIPILLVTGFLGAGKTTFINWLIHRVPEKKISLILNEFGDIKLESQFIEKQGIGLVTELANGCMCCVAKSDIPRVVKYTLDNAPTTETILIEASGLSDPDPVRDVLQAGELTTLVHLNTIVCIVDALNFEKQKNVYPIILSQIGDADLVILSKTSNLEGVEVERLKSVIENIGMGTKVLIWDDALKPNYFLDSHLEKITIPHVAHDHVHEVVGEYWYISDKSLDPQKLYSAFKLFPASIIRAKGYSNTESGKYMIQFVGSKLELFDSNSVGVDLRVDPPTAILFLGNDLDSHSISSLLDDCRIM